MGDIADSVVLSDSQPYSTPTLAPPVCWHGQACNLMCLSGSSDADTFATVPSPECMKEAWMSPSTGSFMSYLGDWEMGEWSESCSEGPSEEGLHAVKPSQSHRIDTPLEARWRKWQAKWHWHKAAYFPLRVLGVDMCMFSIHEVS